jgi:hypothetical protein
MLYHPLYLIYIEAKYSTMQFEKKKKKNNNNRNTL